MSVREVGAGRPGGRSATIGQVLAELRAEFPDISSSKIRFLEAEGLIEPARSQSGYRRFSVADVERLRFILTAQRDEYLPLRVIKERLDARDASGPEPSPVFTRSELLEAGTCPEEMLAELEDYGLIRRSRQYGPDALAVVRSAVALSEFGVQPRHLRAVKAAVERETSLVEQVVAPLARQRGGREPAARTAAQVAALIETLHSTLTASALTEAGLVAAVRPAQASPERVEGTYSERGLRSASGR
jgi:DNA-binding transcriptional MerR regulator